MEEKTRGQCTLALLNYRLLKDELQPTVARARSSATAADAITELRGLVARIEEASQRDDALAQLERIEHAVQSGRWQRSAAGILLECLCVTEPVVIADRFTEFGRYAEFLFPWDEARTETLLTFIAHLSDHTIPWASVGETWRAALSPRELIAPSEALNAMTRRELRKLLEETEGGGVFSEEEAETIAEWWERVRAALRMAVRLESGLFLRVNPADES